MGAMETKPAADGQAADEADAVLVRKAQGGDHEAFAALIQKHWQTARRLTRRLISEREEAEDILQEAALAAYLNLRSLNSADRFAGWFCGIVLNHCRMYRRRAYRSLRPEPLKETMRSREGDAHAIADEHALLAEVATALRLLPEAQRQAALLVYLVGFTPSEAAAALGISGSALKVRLHRARRSLRSQFGVSSSEARRPRGRRRLSMVELEVFDVAVRRMVKDGREISNGVILLREKAGSRVLPVWVGEAEATALALELQGVQYPRPLTYHFAAALLEAAGATVRSATISKLVEDTFYATVAIQQGETVPEVDARPSDAINLALRANAPVFADEEVLAKCPERVKVTKAGRTGSAAVVQRFEELRRLANQVMSEEAPTAHEAWRELGVEFLKDDA
jgi:RNA polymerase sigma factor (sigma-70 family)